MSDGPGTSVAKADVPSARAPRASSGDRSAGPASRGAGSGKSAARGGARMGSPEPSTPAAVATAQGRYGNAEVARAATRARPARAGAKPPLEAGALAGRRSGPVQGAVASPTAQKPGASGTAGPEGKLLAEGSTLDLDMTGGLTSRELQVSIRSDDRSTLELGFRHVAGTRTATAVIRPTRIRVEGARLRSVGSTDGIHPLEIQLAGTSSENEAKVVIDTLFLAPGPKPGAYLVMEGKEWAPAEAVSVDLGVPETFGEVGEKLVEQVGDITKEGGAWEIGFLVGPGRAIRAALYLIKDPDDDGQVLCYFAMAATKEGASGIQTRPSTTMKVALPVTFEELDLEKHAESDTSLTYRFLPPQYERGIRITYEMNPADAAGRDPANALHGLNVYAVDTRTGAPEGTVPSARAAFRQRGGSWVIGYERRTAESLRIESAKDALEKLPKIQLPKNELATLTSQMSLLAMAAVKEGVASKGLLAQWMELSAGVTLYGPAASIGDETARGWLERKSDLFLRALVIDIGTRGVSSEVNARGVGPGGGAITTTYTNKYTGAIAGETSGVGAGSRADRPITSEIQQPFAEVRGLFAAARYEEAIAKLRAAYYLWLEDQLLEYPGADKDVEERLRSYGYQMSYRRLLKEELASHDKPLRKVRALYYPDLGNVKGANEYGREWRLAGVDKVVGLPLDVYYQDAGTEWVLYNFTTLTEPGKLNGFRRTWTKGPGEFSPPQEMWDLLTKDEGVGTGYVHYQTEVGEGGIVRVDHPWTLGGVLLAAAAVIGLIALALTGVGLLFEGAAIGGVTAAGAATVLGDVAMITALAGGTIKLATDVAEGAPVTAGQVAGLALDVATAVLPVVRSLRSVAALARYKSMFVLLDTAANAKWAARLELAANTTALVVGTGKGIEELIELSKALEEGRIDEATFYWAVARNVGLGAINVVLLRSGMKALEGRTIGNTTMDEVVQKSLARELLEAKPDAMYTRETLEAGIEIMQDSSSVYRSMVLEALADDAQLEKAVDVLCYLGKKERGGLDDVVILDGKVRRAVDVLVEGKFLGKTLTVPQGFSGSKGEALDEVARDFAAFSRATAKGVHDLSGLANAEVRMQGSATMGIARPKKPTPAEPQAPGPAAGSPGKAPPAESPWDVDIAVMLEPKEFASRTVDAFRGKVKHKSKGPIDLDKMSYEELTRLANEIHAEEVANKVAKARAKAAGEAPLEGEMDYNADARTFANDLVTGKANPGSKWSRDLSELRERLRKEFGLPKLDLSIIAKGSGFDSSPYVVLQ